MKYKKEIELQRCQKFKKCTKENWFKLNMLERGYEEVTEQLSSSSGCFLLFGCNGFLDTESGCS
jgi:hypothetical protein